MASPEETAEANEIERLRRLDALRATQDAWSSVAATARPDPWPRHPDAQRQAFSHAIAEWQRGRDDVEEFGGRVAKEWSYQPLRCPVCMAYGVFQSASARIDPANPEIIAFDPCGHAFRDGILDGDDREPWTAEEVAFQARMSALAHLAEMPAPAEGSASE